MGHLDSSNSSHPSQWHAVPFYLPSSPAGYWLQSVPSEFTFFLSPPPLFCTFHISLVGGVISPRRVVFSVRVDSRDKILLLAGRSHNSSQTAWFRVRAFCMKLFISITTTITITTSLLFLLARIPTM